MEFIHAGYPPVGRMGNHGLGVGLRKSVRLPDGSGEE